MSETSKATRQKAGAVAGLVTLAPLVALGAAEHADAKTIRVTNKHAHGKGSFKHAVRKANKTKHKDKIMFASKLSGSITTGEVQFPYPVALVSKSDDFTLKGEGDAVLAILSDKRHPEDKSNAIRHLQGDGIRITGGYYTALKIVDVTLAGHGEEIGIDTYGATIERSTITGFDTGVRSVENTSWIVDSLIAGNGTGVQTGGGGVLLERSLLTGNHEVAFAGGGYYGRGSIVDSTIAGNDGWALVDAPHVYDSTISGNNGFDKNGYGTGSRYKVKLTNSIVSGNPRSDGPACTGELPESRGGNVLDLDGGCAIAPTDRDVVADPRLEPLADNGGPTQTMALKADSPAIGLAIPEEASKTDQRGVPRGPDPDSGAYQRALCGDVPVGIVGTGGADVLHGTPEADGILALNGADRIFAGAGDDAICASNGRDHVRAGKGDDFIDGGRGKDRCHGGQGVDTAKRCEDEKGVERLRSLRGIRGRRKAGLR